MGFTEVFKPGFSAQSFWVSEHPKIVVLYYTLLAFYSIFNKEYFESLKKN